LAGHEMPLEPPSADRFGSLKNLFSLLSRTERVKVP
jgi:hypothetical protein